MLSETVAILFSCFLAGTDGILRTAMQKILYFASQKGILEDSFGRGYYGPFSADVANSAESLVSTNFLNETVEFFLESIGYRYSLTSDGNKIIPELQKQIPTNLAEELGKILDLCRNQTATSLSIAAKVHYILKRMNIPMTAEQIAGQAEKLKWNISPEEVVKASKLLEELELIK